MLGDLSKKFWISLRKVDVQGPPAGAVERLKIAQSLSQL
jgi:hypothetical protein